MGPLKKSLMTVLVLAAFLSAGSVSAEPAASSIPGGAVPQPSSALMPVETPGDRVLRAEVVEALGDASVQTEDGGEFSKLSKGAVLRAGDVIKTGQGSCRLLIDGKTKVSVTGDKFAMAQFVPNFHFASALRTLIIALGRCRIATSPARKRAWESLGFSVRKSGGMTFCWARATHFSRPLTASALPDGVNSVLEIVLDGLSAEAIGAAMRTGISAACRPGVRAISAGNYGGKLGPYHFHLRKIMESAAS